MKILNSMYVYVLNVIVPTKTIHSRMMAQQYITTEIFQHINLDGYDNDYEKYNLLLVEKMDNSWGIQLKNTIFHWRQV